MGCKKLYSSPFSGAAFGAIFPAAAFFPSTCTEGTSVPVEVVGGLLVGHSWVAFLPGCVSFSFCDNSSTVWTKVVGVEKFSYFYYL